MTYTSTIRLNHALASTPKLKKTISFEIKILSYHGASGYTDIYFITRTNITLVTENDFGWPTRELFSTSLSSENSKALFAHAVNVVNKNLNEKYVTPGIADGLQMFFHFRMNGAAEKKISLSNLMPKELYMFVVRINSLLPKQHRLTQPHSASGIIK
jgi:hypothetical protein